MPPEPTRNFVVPPAMCPITTAVAALAIRVLGVQQPSNGGNPELPYAGLGADYYPTLGPDWLRRLLVKDLKRIELAYSPCTWVISLEINVVKLAGKSIFSWT